MLEASELVKHEPVGPAHRRAGSADRRHALDPAAVGGAGATLEDLHSRGRSDFPPWRGANPRSSVLPAPARGVGIRPEAAGAAGGISGARAVLADAERGGRVTVVDRRIPRVRGGRRPGPENLEGERQPVGRRQEILTPCSWPHTCSPAPPPTPAATPKPADTAAPVRGRHGLPEPERPAQREQLCRALMEAGVVDTARTPTAAS